MFYFVLEQPETHVQRRASTPYIYYCNWRRLPVLSFYFEDNKLKTALMNDQKTSSRILYTDLGMTVLSVQYEF